MKSNVRRRRRDIAAPSCDIHAAALRDVPRRDFLDVDANRIRRVTSFGSCVRTHCRLYRHRQAEDQSRYYCKPHTLTSIDPRHASRSYDAKVVARKLATPGVLADALCVTPLFPPRPLARGPLPSARVAPRHAHPPF